MQQWNGGGGRNNPNSTLKPLFPKKKDSTLNIMFSWNISQSISIIIINNEYILEQKERDLVLVQIIKIKIKIKIKEIVKNLN